MEIISGILLMEVDFDCTKTNISIRVRMINMEENKKVVPMDQYGGSRVEFQYNQRSKIYCSLV